MKGEDLLKAIGAARPEYVEHAASSGHSSRRRWVLAGRIAAVAAGFALVIFLGMVAPKLLKREPEASEPSADRTETLPSAEEPTSSLMPTVSTEEIADTPGFTEPESSEPSGNHGSSGGIKDSYLVYNGILYIASGRLLDSLPEGCSEVAEIALTDPEHIPTTELSATQLKPGTLLYLFREEEDQVLLVEREDGQFELYRESYTHRAGYDLPELVAGSRRIFRGTVTSEADEQGKRAVYVTEVFRGNAEETILIQEPPDHPLETGQDYLFFGEKYGDVIHDQTYYLINELVYPLGSAVSSLAIRNLDVWGSFEEICSAMPRLAEENPLGAFYQLFSENDYIHSSDAEEVKALSEYVAELKVNAVTKTLKDRIWCECEVLQTIKGDLAQGDRITVIVPFELVESGNRYIACLKKIDGLIVNYIISAPGSMYPTEP